MHKIVVFIFLNLVFISCRNPIMLGPKEGIWLAELKTMDHQILPFNFRLTKSANDTYQIKLFNASETIVVDEIEIKNDSIFIKPPVFEGYIAAKFTGNTMNGIFIKESLNRIVPFKASFGSKEKLLEREAPTINVSGQWEVEFNSNTVDVYPAIGIFVQNGTKVTGTFRTTTGDYRYLDGLMYRDSIRLSTFDGAHAFLFVAKVSDSTLMG